MGATNRIVVLDDDPTGIQTVHGCTLLTRWDPASLRLAFEDTVPFFYVLTNTRARTREKAKRIVSEIVRNVLALNREFGDSLIFISRSDSTLRSHFPVEVRAILEAVNREQGQPVDAVFLVPAFFEGGRLTANDVHYLIEGDRRIPTSESEFARDSVFGYSTSHLPRYIEEKTQGAVKAESVQSVSLEMLRSADTTPFARFLDGLRGGGYVAVNAEDYADLDRFAAGLLSAAAAGKRFVFQSAASLVKALAKVPDKPLLGGEILRRRGRGLFVVGSHVKKSTHQLQRLLATPGVEGLELGVAQILAGPEPLLGSSVERVLRVWQAGRTPVVYTSRRERQFPSKEERLSAGERISGFLVQLVRGMPEPLSFLVAKGGITSHDILVDGLGVSRATVLGQILPGVPVVRVPEGNRFAGMPYVIFPGNVGGDDALVQVFGKLG
ncbi:MAG: four-carbon acid sugar kinase family protein [Kiritimatiellae bacterium]|nr:four-carbon acid sugar kinase family protein [Kiritimatiellia bacterium]